MLQLEQSAADANATDILQKVEQTEYILRLERTRKSIAGGKINGGLVEIDKLDNLVVISDLHGDSKTLFQILLQIDYERFLSNPLNKVVFLGDYVDRGTDSIGVLYAVCHLKVTYPNAVILMRGNHEAPAEFPFSSHDLPLELKERFGNSGKEIYRKLLLMFRLLTLTTTIMHKLLLVHAGLPTDDAANANIKSIIPTQEAHIRNRVLEELLWNDPRDIETELGWEMSTRGLGRYFGRAISRKWLQASSTEVVVRGHEPCHGFRLDHDDIILTLFSSSEAYPEFKAAYLMLDVDQLGGIRNAKDLSRYVRLT